MSDWTRLICAVDARHDCGALLEAAVSLARKLGANLTILHVVPTGKPGTIVAPPERIEALVIEAGPPVREIVRSAAASLGRDVAMQVEHGEPANEILRVARKTGCDLVILGTHGRRGLQRAFFGSVAESVVRAASCPVLTVRPL